MKIMPLLALAGLLALPATAHAGSAVDCGSFPNSQMRLNCWNDTSRALQAYNPGEMPPSTASLRAKRSNPESSKTGLLRRKNSSQ